jgi:hypothetical protein
MPNDRRAFRLRFRDGRFAPAPFPPSLRLRFTFPFAEPQAEAKLRQNYLVILQGAMQAEVFNPLTTLRVRPLPAVGASASRRLADKRPSSLLK